MSTQPNSDPLKTKEHREEPPHQSATSALRQQRVDEYERDELKKPEAFQACLGAIQAEQIRISHALGDAVMQMLTGVKATPEHIRELEPSLSIYLRVTRQIERYRQLEIRQAEVQQKADAIHVRSSDLESRVDTADGPHRQTAK